jgi:hypothetical protein
MQISPNAVRATSADGTTPLPNPRLISDVIGQQPLDADGNTISNPNTFGTNLFLMSFGQFFDHGLDFYARGGGPDMVPIGDMNEQLAAAQLRLDEIRAGATHDQSKNAHTAQSTEPAAMAEVKQRKTSLRRCSARLRLKKLRALKSDMIDPV